MKNLPLIFALFFVLGSCEDDFSINGDPQDITITYGLLNSTDTVQYIKVNKAFLGEGNVYDMAKVSDSIQYPNTLGVKLIEYKLVDDALNPYYADNWERTGRSDIVLTRTNEIPKDTGMFASDKNYLYKTTEPIYPKHKYVLEILNSETGKEVWSETYMIYKFSIKYPINDKRFKVDMANEANPYLTVWESAIYGKIYSTALRFKYLEIQNKDTTEHSVIFNYTEQTLGEVRLPSSGVGTEMRQRVGGEDFYQKVAFYIHEKPGVDRIAQNLDFIYFIGGASFSTYLNVSKSAAGYGQSESAYTNIKNGKGIFDCRLVTTLYNIELTVNSVDSLNRGRFTSNLNFKNYTITK